MDQRRKTFMAIAMWSTLLSIFFTVYGAMALSRDSYTLRNTYWFWLGVTNTTSGQQSAVFLGLSSMVYEFEPCKLYGSSSNNNFVNSCQERTLPYGPAQLAIPFTDYVLYDNWPTEFLEDTLSECRALLATNSVRWIAGLRASTSRWRRR